MEKRLNEYFIKIPGIFFFKENEQRNKRNIEITNSKTIERKK